MYFKIFIMDGKGFKSLKCWLNLKTENIENNNLTKFEIGKAILPTPTKFSTDHVLTQTVANQSTPTFQ
jgi:hypothetical protein